MIKTKRTKRVAISRDDLLAAWSVLENLAVSLDQIGGMYATADSAGNGAASQRAFHEALAGYLKLDLVRDIRAARTRLGQYVSDIDAEKLTDIIPYWDYRATRATSTRNKRKA